MVTKLKLLFRGQRLASALKALVFGGFLELVKIGNFGIIPILFFLVAGLVLYNRPFLKSSAHLTAFLILSLVSLVILNKLNSPVLIITFLSAVAFLFYIILGLKNLFFIYRSRWQYILGLSLFYFVFLIFFVLNKSAYFLWKEIGFVVTNFFLLREFLVFVARDAKIKDLMNRPLKKPSVIAAVITLLLVEEAWLINLLPIGFLNSANLELISVFLLVDLVRCFWQDNFVRRAILTDITIFVLTTLLIFATSQWSF